MSQSGALIVSRRSAPSISAVSARTVVRRRSARPASITIGGPNCTSTRLRNRLGWMNVSPHGTIVIGTLALRRAAEREPRGAGLEPARAATRRATGPRGRCRSRRPSPSTANIALERGVVGRRALGGRPLGPSATGAARRAVVIVLARDRHRAEAAQDRAHDPALEQRVLRGEVNLAAAGRDDQDRIDQRVRVIAGEQHRPGRRHVLEPGDLDLAEEHPRDDAQEPRQDPIRHRTMVPGLRRSSRRSARRGAPRAGRSLSSGSA